MFPPGLADALVTSSMLAVEPLAVGSTGHVSHHSALAHWLMQSRRRLSIPSAAIVHMDEGLQRVLERATCAISGVAASSSASIVIVQGLVEYAPLVARTTGVPIPSLTMLPAPPPSDIHLVVVTHPQSFVIGIPSQRTSQALAQSCAAPEGVAVL